MGSIKSVVDYSWLLFWFYWFFVATIRNRPAAAKHRKDRTQRIVLLLIVLVVLISSGHYEFLARSVAPHSLTIKIIGALFFYVGLSVCLWARQTLGGSWAMAGTVQRNPRLVTSGPYKVIRHPIYSGLLLAAIGTALTQSYAWFAIFAASFVMFTISALKEESALSKQLPKEYPAYKKRTKMLIPYLF